MDRSLPTPVANADSQFYWAGVNEGRLRIRRCRSCHQAHFMPRYLCPTCWSEDLEWIESSGRGTVHSFTIVRRAALPAFAGEVPYVLALIDLQEGPRMMTNIVGSTRLETKIGDPVEVVFEDRGKDSKIPQFTRKV